MSGEISYDALLAYLPLTEEKLKNQTIKLQKLYSIMASNFKTNWKIIMQPLILMTPY